MSKRLFREIGKHREVYWFLLPALIALLLIVGIPLVNTVWYSFTDMTAQTMAMDTPETKRENEKAIATLGLIVPALERITGDLQAIVDGLAAGRTDTLSAAEAEAHAGARARLAATLADVRRSSTETPDGRYSFETYFSFNLAFLTNQPPATRQRAALLAFERNLLDGDGQNEGLRQRLAAQQRTLADKLSKQPTQYVGFRNYLEILGLAESAQEKTEHQAYEDLAGFLDDLSQSEASREAFFAAHPESLRVFRIFFGKSPEAVFTNGGAYKEAGLAALVRGRRQVTDAATAFAAAARPLLQDALVLARRAREGSGGFDPARLLAQRERLARLVKERDDAGPFLAPYLAIRYGFAAGSMADFPVEGDPALLQETLEARLADIEAIERDNPKPFGFWNIFLQTIIWTLVNVCLHVTLGLYLAHWLQKKLRGNTVYRGLLMLPWTVPSLVAAFSWRLIFDYPDGFLNRVLELFGSSPQNFMSDQWVLTACIIVNVWVGVPFMMITMLGGLQTIPEEQYEAAAIDGANAFQKFVNVTLPGLRPVALVAILLGIIWTFNQFNIIYLVTLGSELKSRNILVTYAYDAFNKYFNYAEAATYGVVILSLLLAFGSYYTRILRKGGEL